MSELSNFLMELLENPSENPEGNLSTLEWQDQTFVDRFFTNSRDGYYEIEEEIEFLKKYLTSSPSLDLGSGRGRLSKPLAETIPVFAIDNSFLSLEGSGVRSICGDYKKLPIKGHFGSIILAFGQICFCNKNELVDLLKRCKKLLKRNGRIYIDLPTIDATQGMHSFGEWEHLQENEESILFTARHYNPVSDIFSQKLINFNFTNSQFVTKWVHYQMYSLYELLELFKDLRLQVIYGAEDFQETPIKEESPWMIFVLQKS